MKKQNNKNKSEAKEQYNKHLLESLLDQKTTNDSLLTFSYFLSKQSEHLYNFQYYFSQIKDYDKIVNIFQIKNLLFSEISDKINKELKLFYKEEFSIRILLDNLYSIDNIDKANIESNNTYFSLEIDDNLADFYSISEISSHNVLVQIKCKNLSKNEQVKIVEKTTNLKICNGKSSNNMCIDIEQSSRKISKHIIDSIDELCKSFSSNSKSVTDEKK